MIDPHDPNAVVTAKVGDIFDLGRMRSLLASADAAAGAVLTLMHATENCLYPLRPTPSDKRIVDDLEIVSQAVLRICDAVKHEVLQAALRVRPEEADYMLKPTQGTAQG